MIRGILAIRSRRQTILSVMAPPYTLLDLRDLHQLYGTTPAVRGVSFTLERGMIACLLGPSGCGKTTVLRCIAGFEPVASGEIHLAGQCVSTPGVQWPPERRRIGMVFQDFALFPHLDVEHNVGFGLRKLSATERAERIRECVQTVGLGGQEHKYPHQLSGGQQQRVALARALAPRPELLLLDEPFSSLDVDLREQLGQEVRDIIHRLGATALLVTHDQQEAFAIADEIGVMRAGRIEQWGSAYELYHRPANRFVADFVGQGCFIPGILRAADQVEIELGVLRGRMPLGTHAEARAGDGRVEVLLRPDDIEIDDASPARARVAKKAFRGVDTLYTLELASGRRLVAAVPSHHDYAVGAQVGIRLDVDHVVAFPATVHE